MSVEYTSSELLAVHASREMVGVNTIFAGVGIPLLAAMLAKETHLPRLTIVVEGGSIGPEVVPGYLPISTNEMRISHRAQQLVNITDIFLLTQRGFLEVGFIGGAQIDQYGNVNTTVIGDYDNPKVRLPGSGGANDIAFAPDAPIAPGLAPKWSRQNRSLMTIFCVSGSALAASRSTPIARRCGPRLAHSVASRAVPQKSSRNETGSRPRSFLNVSIRYSTSPSTA